MNGDPETAPPEPDYPVPQPEPPVPRPPDYPVPKPGDLPDYPVPEPEQPPPGPDEPWLRPTPCSGFYLRIWEAGADGRNNQSFNGTRMTRIWRISADRFWLFSEMLRPIRVMPGPLSTG